MNKSIAVLVSSQEAIQYQNRDGWKENSAIANTLGPTQYWVDLYWKNEQDADIFNLEELRGLNENDIY